MGTSDDFQFKVNQRTIDAAHRRLDKAAHLAERGLRYGNIMDIRKAITQSEHAVEFLYRAYWGAKANPDR